MEILTYLLILFTFITVIFKIVSYKFSLSLSELFHLCNNKIQEKKSFQKESLNNNSISAPRDNLLFKVSHLTAQEAKENAKEIQENAIYSETLLPEGLKGKVNPEKVWEYLEADSITQNIMIIENEILNSQKNSVNNNLMIPLCVPYNEKEMVKRLGAIWCPREKSWYWSFNNNTEEVDKWLPNIYRTNLPQSFRILPRLVPEPLWGLNLRSLLSKVNWDSLRQITYKEYGYRCKICGCRGEKWPVECDEIWEYDMEYSMTHAMVYFKGLQAICPGCHQVHHFGKAKADGKEMGAIARLMVLNNWSYERTSEMIDDCFEEWMLRSGNFKWLFNSDLLEEKYDIFIQDDNYKKMGLSKK